MKKLNMIFAALTMVLPVTTTTADNNDWANLQKYEKQNAAVRLLPKEQRRVVFMGNSITECWTLMRPAFFKDNGYVGRGISGQTSYQFVVRYRQDVIDLHPELVVINTATNDVAENTGPYNEERTMSNIKTMVDLAQANNIKVILTSTLPAAGFGWKPRIKDSAEKIAALNNRIKDYAAQKGIPFVDYYSEMVSGPRRALNPAYTKDGVHPTEAGYAVMEPMIKAAIDEVLGLNTKDRHRKSLAESISTPADNIKVSRRTDVEDHLFRPDKMEKKII